LRIVGSWDLCGWGLNRVPGVVGFVEGRLLENADIFKGLAGCRGSGRRVTVMDEGRRGDGTGVWVGNCLYARVTWKMEVLWNDRVIGLSCEGDASRQALVVGVEVLTATMVEVDLAWELE
jgi:hypothetical protein